MMISNTTLKTLLNVAGYSFKDMDSYSHVDMGRKCLCCDICIKTCSCGVCKNKLTKFLFCNNNCGL